MGVLLAASLLTIARTVRAEPTSVSVSAPPAGPPPDYVAAAQDQDGPSPVAPCTLPLRIQVAQRRAEEAAPPGEAVVSQAWVKAQVARANRIFAGTGIAFAIASLTTHAAIPAHFRTRSDRHGLGSHIKPGAVQIFAVETLHDVDEADRLRSGVHWKVRGPATPPWEVSAPRSPTLSAGCQALLARSQAKCALRPHLIILAQQADRDVLAHELGHFFGNRQHDHTPGNVMSYVPGEADVPVFTTAQVARVRETAACLVREGEITPLTARQAPLTGPGQAPVKPRSSTDQAIAAGLAKGALRP